MFLETRSRLDTLITMFNVYPNKSIRYVVKRKGKRLKTFVILESSFSTSTKVL